MHEVQENAKFHLKLLNYFRVHTNTAFCAKCIFESESDMIIRIVLCSWQMMFNVPNLIIMFYIHCKERDCAIL